MILPRLTSWPVRTAEHVDLWLHAFALLSTDSTMLPLFAPRYRDSLTVVKNRAAIFTALDSNHLALSRGLSTRGGYLRAQLLPLEFTSWEVFRRQAELFLNANSATRSSFSAAFPAATDRDWLRAFLDGVQSEQQKFYAEDYSRVLRGRARILSAVDSLWTGVYRRKFERFLTRTEQGTGDLVLALPIAAAGRVGVGRDRHLAIVVPFPARLDDVHSVLFVFAHEVTGSTAAAVVADIATAVERRNGVADRYVSMGQVRAGEQLISAVAPELSDEYMRYYLMQSGVTSANSMPISRLRDAFTMRFTLPSEIRDALAMQLESVLRGN